MVARIQAECAGIFTEDEELGAALIKDFSALILELKHAIQRANPGFVADGVLRVLVSAHPFIHLKPSLSISLFTNTGPQNARSQYGLSSGGPVPPLPVSGERVAGSAGSGSGDAYLTQ